MAWKRKICDGLIMTAKVEEVLADCPRGNSLGLDGLPYELFKMYADLFGARAARRNLHCLAAEQENPQFCKLESGDFDQKGPEQ